MIFFVRTTKSLGNNEVYARLRNAIGRYWNFTSLTWDAVESSNTKVFMTEYADADSVESLYQSVDKNIPSGGPWRQEAVLNSTGEVLAYDNTSSIIEVELLQDEVLTPLTALISRLIRAQYFAYVGNASNIVSIVDGSFTGSISFYFVSESNFLANPIAAPLSANKICTLNSSGSMTETAGIANSGDILLFSLNSFNALDDLTINLYNNATKSNIRIYLPSGLSQSSSSVPYYPTTVGSIMTTNGVDLVNISETAYGKALAQIPYINWDRISQPVVVNQPTLLVDNVVRMNFALDRTIDVQFDLHRNITGDSIYFAMKTDRNNEYYDVEPILCIIDDAINGLISLTIPETSTINLNPSKYYGELMRITAAGKYQTLIKFDIDLTAPIISTRDL